MLLKIILQIVKKEVSPKELIIETKTTQQQAKPIMPGLKPGVVMGAHGLQNKSSEDNFEFPQVTDHSKKPVELEETPKQEGILGKRRTNRYNDDANLDKEFS
jgi:hypothetical protein